MPKIIHVYSRGVGKKKQVASARSGSYNHPLRTPSVHYFSRVFYIATNIENAKMHAACLRTDGAMVKSIVAIVSNLTGSALKLKICLRSLFRFVILLQESLRNEATTGKRRKCDGTFHACRAAEKSERGK